MKMVKVLWVYRGFIIGGVQREFESKYRNSLLDAAWTEWNLLTRVLYKQCVVQHVRQIKIVIPGIYA